MSHVTQPTTPEWLRSHGAFLVGALGTGLYVVAWVVAPWPYVYIPMLPMDAISLAVLLTVGAIGRLAQSETALRDVELGVLSAMCLTSLGVMVTSGELVSTDNPMLVVLLVAYWLAAVSITVALGFALGASLARRGRQ